MKDLWIVTVWLIIFMAGLVTGVKIQDSDHEEMYQFKQKLAQCEAELPRNQSCEVVVTAKIKDNKEN